MSAVKRYGHISYLVEACPQIMKLYPSMTVYVLASDFDRVTAERDALQQRLTAADERADVLEGLLREVQKSARKQDWARGYPTLFASVDAVLKPACPAKCERCGCSTVETCDERGCGFLGAGNGAPE